MSKSLVSRVLRAEPNVSAARRDTVLAAMSDLGYRPNGMARGLSESRSGTVGVMLNDLRNPWFVSLLEGLTTALDAVGMAPVLADSHLDQRVGSDTVETLLRNGSTVWSSSERPIWAAPSSARPSWFPS